MKKLFLVMLVIFIYGSTCYAGQLGQNEKGSFYVKDDGNLAISEWVTIDITGEGKEMFYYYFGADGIMLKNCVTPDNYLVNAEGKWVVDGVVKTAKPAKKPSHWNVDILKSRITNCKISKSYLFLNGTINLAQTEDGTHIWCYGMENNGKKYRVPNTNNGFQDIFNRPQRAYDYWTDSNGIARRDSNEVSKIQFENSNQDDINIDTNITSFICKISGESVNEEDFYFNILCNSIGLVDIVVTDASQVEYFINLQNNHTKKTTWF